MLNFHQLPKNMSTSGRYTVEINLVESFDNVYHHMAFSMPVTDVLMLTFEDATYKEPKRIEKVNYWLITIIVAIAGSVVYGAGASCV